jgi:hypothetical protein
MKLAGRVRQERQKPNLRGFKVYIGDFVAPEDPGNDPQDLGANPPIDTSPSSPPFQNGFYYSIPLWFAHGLDGETDMGGMYDLITGGPGGVPPVSGDIAWNCPAEWRDGMQLFADFAVLLDDPGDPEDRVYGMALQVFDPASGNVRVYWPLYATALP